MAGKAREGDGGDGVRLGGRGDSLKSSGVSLAAVDTCMGICVGTGMVVDGDRAGTGATLACMAIDVASGAISGSGECEGGNEGPWDTVSREARGGPLMEPL